MVVYSYTVMPVMSTSTWARCDERFVKCSRVHLVHRSDSSTPSSEAASPAMFCSTTTSRAASPSRCVFLKPLGLRRCHPDHSTTIIMGLPPQHHQRTARGQAHRSHHDHHRRSHHRRCHHDQRHHRRCHHDRPHNLCRQSRGRCPRQCCLVHRHRCRDEPCPRRHRGKHPLLGVARHRSLPKLLQILAVLGVLVHGQGTASSIHRSCRPASSKSSTEIGRRRRLHSHALLGFTMHFTSSRRPSRSSLQQLQALVVLRVLVHRVSSHRRRSDTKPLVIIRLPIAGAVLHLPTGLLRPSRFPGVCSLCSDHHHHRCRPQPTMVLGQQPSWAAVLHQPRLLRPSRRPATRGLRLRVLWHPP